MIHFSRFFVFFQKYPIGWDFCPTRWDFFPASGKNLGKTFRILIPKAF